MRVLRVAIGALALPFVVAAEKSVDGFAFSDLAVGPADHVVGHLATPADETPGPSFSLAPSAPSVATTPTPSSSTPRVQDFGRLDGSFDAAHVSDVANAEPHTTPPAPSSNIPSMQDFGALNGSFDAARVGDADETVPPVKTVVVLADAGSVAFSALPVSPGTDIQGFPFGAGNTTAPPSPVANATTDPQGQNHDESWWQRQVCASSPASCALVGPTGNLERRLVTAASTMPSPGDISELERNLRNAAELRMASNLLLVAAGFASTGVGALLGAFAIVLCVFFAQSASEAVRQLLIAVNSEYLELDDIVRQSASRLQSSTEVNSIRRSVGEANSYHRALMSAAASAKDAPGAIGQGIRTYCAQNPHYHDFVDALFDTQRAESALEGYYVTRSSAYVGEAAFYLSGLFNAYLSLIKCELSATRTPADLKQLEKLDTSYRTKMTNVAKAMGDKAKEMRTKMAGTITEEVARAVSGSSKADMTALNDKYDWVIFKSDVSPVLTCDTSTTDVADSECGLVSVSKANKCHFIGWYSRVDKDATMKVGVGLSDEYNGLGDKRCGYAKAREPEERPPRTPPMHRRHLVSEARAPAAPTPRRLEKQAPAYEAYVKGSRASGSSPEVPKVPDTVLDQSTKDAALDPLLKQLNAATTEKERMNILAKGYNSSSLSQSIKSRDMAMWFALETNLKEVKDMYDERDAIVDGVSSTVKDVHEIEMGRIQLLHDDVVTTGTQEVRALVDLEVKTTEQHLQEIGEMDKIDGQLNTLESTLTTGFAGTTSDIDKVEQDTTSALQKLSGTVTDAGAKTRQEVKAVIKQATEQTMAQLDNLEDLVVNKGNEKLNGIKMLQNIVERSSTELRENVATEFDNRIAQLQSRVTAAASYVMGAGEVTANALVSESDAMRTELGRRIAFMTQQLVVIDQRITMTQQTLKRMDTQIDEILGFMASINSRLTGIFRSLRDLPNRIRQVLMVKTVQDKMRTAERLSYAYANYMKHSMNQLQAFEFLQQCNVAREGLLFDSLLERLSRSEAVLRRELQSFNDSRIDYEQYGNRIAIAAYHLRYMLIPCGNMRDLDATGTAVMGEATSRAQANKLNTAIWTFQLNMEETVPALFVQKIYTTPYVQTALEDVRRSIGVGETFALPAIELLRFHLQQQLGSFAGVSVINAPQRGRISVWTKGSTTATIGASRFGLLRFNPRDEDLVVLYSSTPRQIPSHLLDGFNLNITAQDLTTARLATVFQNSAYASFWTAGFIQSVVFVERVNKTCPWAIASDYYPHCWETGVFEDGGCVCVQIEGLATTVDASRMTTGDGPTPWALQTTISGTSPRANFLVTAIDKAPTKMTKTDLLGFPTNRRDVALCMSSPLPPRQCLTTGRKWCHQPPPSFTRCLANPAETYNVVYANDSSSAVFIKDGLSVSSDMFLTLEMGRAIPDVSFFAEQNGNGSYIVCTDCSMDVLRSVYMFRVMSFKIGRPAFEKTTTCRVHPRYSNVEFCTRSRAGELWTTEMLLEHELISSVQQFGRSLPTTLTDPYDIATRVADHVTSLLGTSLSFFKVYVASTGSFNAPTNAANYWTSLPTHTDHDDRGWTVVPAFYSAIVEGKASVFDVLVMWGTTPIAVRPFAKLVIDQKPAGQSLRAYLDTRFTAYEQEKIVRGFFSEPFTGLDCPVAGDTDHFAYCTPSPVDKLCMCIQFEDLPEEYTEKYDGSAANGKVVSFAVDPEQSAFVVGRSKGPFTLGNRVATTTWDRQPRRNLSDVAVCVSDYNRPELGASCVTDRAADPSVAVNAQASAAPDVRVGADISLVTISTPSWTAQCTGCSDAFIAQVAHFADQASVSLESGLMAGGSCARSPADGGGEVFVCLNPNAV